MFREGRVQTTTLVFEMKFCFYPLLSKNRFRNSIILPFLINFHLTLTEKFRYFFSFSIKCAEVFMLIIWRKRKSVVIYTILSTASTFKNKIIFFQVWFLNYIIVFSFFCVRDLNFLLFCWRNLLVELLKCLVNETHVLRRNVNKIILHILT